MRFSGSAIRVAVVTLAAAMLVSACGGGSSGAGQGAAAPADNVQEAAVTAGAGLTPGASSTQRAVGLHGALAVHKEANASSAVVVRLPSATPLGSPRVLLVQEVVPGWVRVVLPMRPNGTSGWVAADDVRLETVRDQIIVDLSTRRMTLVVGGRTLTTSRVAIGSTKDPTPTGRFFVTDRVRPPNPNGVYGAFALGLSAHSQTLSEFGSGDGQIGIHGTNAPTSIGEAVSHGCIRVPADVADLLARIPLGTPVVIT